MADARQTALSVLNRLDQEGKTLDRILLALPQGENYLPKRDRSLLNAMVYGVLRWRGRLDHVIAHFSDSPISRIQPSVLNILRLGLFQIIFLDRIPVSAAVNTAVELTKKTQRSRAAGFVNALLRKAAVHYSEVPFATFQQDPLAYLTTAQSIPKWLAKRWLKRLPAEIIIILSKSINTIPPITLRTHTLKTNRERLGRSLENQVDHLALTPFAPDGICIRNPKKPIQDLAAFKKGWFQVQDEAAQLVSLLLDPQPGECVLDACAGLGGKTAHMAQLMQNQGLITALDNNPEKLRLLNAEMQRLSVSIVKTVSEDLDRYPVESPSDRYDRILVDAPCSGLGVMRRNPDIKWNSSAAALVRRSETQKRILINLAARVKPNGILVYAVCSMEPEENEAVIQDFLKNQPDFVIDNDLGKLPAAFRASINPDTGFTTLAFIEHMDGFFLARLKRKK
ncbi:MAG: 16S rRNA (cytosine(967)-C(5))-methyltransferase RsmB [Desulfobacterales bacterium]|jgi:16S rRNA (cytosine967-C5)-methyltransferase